MGPPRPGDDDVTAGDRDGAVDVVTLPPPDAAGPPTPADPDGLTDAGEGTGPGGEPPVCAGDAATDTCTRWQATVPRGGDRNDRVVGGHVVSVGPSGVVAALDTTDGSEAWTTRVPTAPEGAADEVVAWWRSTMQDAPAALLEPVAGTVVVQRGETLTFLDASSGAAVGQLRLPLTPTATASLGPWLVATDGARIVAVGIPGEIAWDRPVPSGHEATLRSHGSYLTVGDEVVRLSSNTGSEAWRTDLGGPVRPLDATTEDGSALHAVDGGAPALVALSPSDGTERWRVPVTGTVGEVAVGRSRILVGVEDREAGTTAVLILAPDAEDRFLARRELVLKEARGITQLTLIGRQVVAVTHGPHPEVVVATPDGFARLRRPATASTRVTTPDTSTLLITDERGVTAVALATGAERYALPLPGASPVPGSSTVVRGPRQLAELVPRP